MPRRVPGTTVRRDDENRDSDTRRYYINRGGDSVTLLSESGRGYYAAPGSVRFYPPEDPVYHEDNGYWFEYEECPTIIRRMVQPENIA